MSDDIVSPQEPKPNKGGRPTSRESRRRRVAALLERIADSDLVSAESLFDVLTDKTASAGVRVQAVTALVQIKDRMKIESQPRASVGATGPDVCPECGQHIDDAIIDGALRRMGERATARAAGNEQQEDAVIPAHVEMLAFRRRLKEINAGSAAPARPSVGETR